LSLNQVNSSGELERVAGLVNSEKINEMYEAFPSDASASNQLVTESDADDLRIQSISTGTYNDITTSGHYFVTIGDSDPNKPVVGYNFFLHVYEGQNGMYVRQIAYMAGQDHNETYSRAKYNGSWGAWQKLVTESDVAHKTLFSRDVVLNTNYSAEELTLSESANNFSFLKIGIQLSTVSGALRPMVFFMDNLCNMQTISVFEPWQLFSASTPAIIEYARAISINGTSLTTTACKKISNGTSISEDNRYMVITSVIGYK